MQNQHEKIFSILKENIKQLVSLYEQSNKVNSVFSREKNELLVTIKEKDLKISALQEENNNLKIAKSIVSGEDTHNAKIKINQIVKEIDRCIALLNK